MEPSATEIEVSKMACILDELNGGKIDKVYWKGYHPKVYSQTYDKYNNSISKEELEKILVIALKKVDVTKYSLEVQMWWRDYKERDKVTKSVLKEKRKQDKIKEKALAKLTPEEKAVLHL
jgi:hypothetical protein